MHLRPHSDIPGRTGMYPKTAPPQGPSRYDLPLRGSKSVNGTLCHLTHAGPCEGCRAHAVWGQPGRPGSRDFWFTKLPFWTILGGTRTPVVEGLYLPRVPDGYDEESPRAGAGAEAGACGRASADAWRCAKIKNPGTTPHSPRVKNDGPGNFAKILPGEGKKGGIESGRLCPKRSQLRTLA